VKRLKLLVQMAACGAFGLGALQQNMIKEDKFVFPVPPKSSS
jgi:hypothetical protein